MEDIWVAYFSKYTIACTEFFGDNKSNIIRRNVVVLLRFENREFYFLPHSVLRVLAFILM
jgi:hypothetical protein